MTVRNYSRSNPSNTYSAENEIDLIESRILEIMLMVGMDQNNLDTVTIDDIILGIREKYPFTKNDIQNGITTITAPLAYMNNLNLLLVSSARRLWFRYQIAKAVSQNA